MWLTSSAGIRWRPCGAGLAALLLVGAQGCGSELRQIPDELQGVWRTGDPRFADRTLELRAEAVVFATPDPATYAVVSVRVERSEERLDVLISYLGEEQQPYSLHLSFFPAQQELELANRAGVRWRRLLVGAAIRALPSERQRRGEIGRRDPQTSRSVV